MTQQTNIKSFFLKACLLLGVFTFCSPFLRADADQIPVVLGFSHRVAIETLFRYCAMEKNPYYLEREKRIAQQEERLRKILEKRGQDLTPFQQIELLKYTFDLRFADSLVAQTLKAFILSWIVQAAVEFWWRDRCLRTSDFKIIVDSKVKSVDAFRVDVAQTPGVIARTSFLFGRPTVVSKLINSMRQSFGYEEVPFLKEMTKEIDLNDAAERVFSYQDENHQTKFVLQQTPVIEFAQKPAQLNWTMFALNYGIKLAPLLMFAGKHLLRYATSNDKTPENFLDGVFKNFSSEFVAGFGSKDHKKYLLEVLIKPLWKKHNGREFDICTDLAQLGEKLRTLEGTIEAGSTKQKVLYSLVMGVHGGVLPFEHAKLPQRINQAFEHGIVHRALKAGLFTGMFIGARTVLKALVARQFSENFAKGKNDYLIVCGLLFTYWTLKECATKAWNYDNPQARKDYNVFIQRLELQKQEQYRESFYWGWFYPMWRTHKRDVLEVEACFLKRVDEVKKLFESRVVA